MEGSGAGLILADQEGRETTYALRFNFPASNNESEYEALIAGLSLASSPLDLFSAFLAVNDEYEVRFPSSFFVIGSATKD